MCSLFVLLRVDPETRILVAANRDERRDRPASPPGLFVGARRRILSPRDRRAGGTWMAINDAGWFAGLTNVAGGPRFAAAESRGRIPHLVLDQVDFGDIPRALADEVAARVYDDFRLLVTDGTTAFSFSHSDRALRCDPTAAVDLVITDQHALHGLRVPALAAVRAPGLSVQQRLDRLAPLLLDEGAVTGHRVLERGAEFGTVSSSLVAVPAAGIEGLVWQYAAGSPDTTPYRNYGNLGRRLRAEHA